MASTIRELDHLRIPLQEIADATNNFADENIIGKGGLGNVYKGQLMRSGTLIEISARRLYRKDGRQVGNIEFLTEISMLSSLEHPHIVSMIGFCEEKGEKIIVNSYHAKGSLMMHLSDPVSFDWHKRKKISVQIAEAICYLHGFEQQYNNDNLIIIHRNINSLTILLDDDYQPKLSGFEYSIKVSIDRKEHIYLCEPLGTRGYMDPEIVKNGGVNHKSDIYSFGVVLFEILCGRKANQDNSLLAPLAKFHYEQGTLQDIIHPDLWKQKDSKLFKCFLEVAYSCLHNDWTRRPDAKQVLGALEKEVIHEENLTGVKSTISNYNWDLESKSGIWQERLKMCIDAANELNCLHSEIRESHIFDFGVLMFKFLCGDEVRLKLLQGELIGNTIRQLHGSKSYKDKRKAHVAPEWLSDRETIKNYMDDILRGENGVSNLFLNKGPNKDSLDTFINIACQCVLLNCDEPPTMEVIILELQKALTFQANHKDNFRMSFEDIKLATQNFSVANVIGGGGFGMVYKGKLADRNGKGYYPIVAKKLDTRHGQGDKEFYTELQILYEYKHGNIIGLVGYSNETDEKIIVYEHASKGSLDKYLNNASLTWRNRLKICIDFAVGLHFLHDDFNERHAVIHRDIKSSNILLFDDWNAKIGDFGLSLITSTKDYTIDIACGTSGYVDPVYLKSGLLTKESDIYSFGVVLFEILLGKSVYEIHKHESESLLSFITHNFEKGKQDDIVFKAIKEQIAPKSLTGFLNILYQCLDYDPKKRPSSKEVLEQLKWAFQFQEDYDRGCCLAVVTWLLNCEI